MKVEAEGGSAKLIVDVAQNKAEIRRLQGKVTGESLTSFVALLQELHSGFSKSVGARLG